MAKNQASQDEPKVGPFTTPVIDQKAAHNEPEAPPTDPVDEQKPDISDDQKEDAKAETPDEAGEKSEDPKNTEPADTALDVQPKTENELYGGYKIEEGDFINYPELKDQGVNIGDSVAYGSLWVLKQITATAPRTTRVSWPASVNSISY